MGSLMGAAFMVLLPEVVQAGADLRCGQRRLRLELGARDLLPAGDGGRRRHHPVPDLRARWPGASLAPDQGLLEALPYSH